MKATLIDYKDTKSFSKLLLHYLQGEESLRPFYAERPDLSGLERQLKLKTSPHRGALVDALLQQYQGYEQSGAVFQNIERLRSSDTFTVTTGHQLNLFTGPLYFIFKIVSAIKLSRELQQAHPHKHFVPVFWMASEDHDFQEINHTTVFGKKIEWNTQAGGATGRISTQDIEPAVKAYQQILGLTANSEKLADLIGKAYLKHDTLAGATRFLVHELFKTYGLVILDADRKELKKIFAPVMQQDILGQISYQKINQTTRSLEEAGYKAQVHLREINFFYLQDGMRERIVREPGGDFQVLNQALRFSPSQLSQELEKHPERFSPNALLRPLYQEYILPNIGYVGGAAEIAYWMQLKGMFEYYQVPFPVLIPRNSAMLTDDRTAEKIFRLNFTFKSMFKSAEALKKEYVRLHSSNRLNLDDEWRDMKGLFEKIKLRAHKIDPSLGPSTDAVKARLKHNFDRLEKKLVKAEQRNFSEAQVQIERLKEKLFPGEVLQERVENFAYHYLQYGDTLIEHLLENFKPLDFRFTVLY